MIGLFLNDNLLLSEHDDLVKCRHFYLLVRVNVKVNATKILVLLC